MNSKDRIDISNIKHYKTTKSNMPDYQQGKIYTIRCYDDPTSIYVGSTTQSLSQRWAGHKRDSLKNPHRIVYSIINNIWEEWYIELYELYPCNSKIELEKREGEVIRQIGSLNQVISGRTRNEYLKQYRELNREQNADKNKEYNKRYREKNEDKIKERMKEYQQQSADKIRL